MSRSFVALSLAVSCLALGGCKKEDPKTPEYWQSSLEGAKRPDDKVRVIESLRTSGNVNEQFLPFLHGRLSSERRPEVKAAVARTLGDLHHPTSLEPLTAALDPGASDVPAQQVNKAVVGALGRIGDERAVPSLVPLLRSKDNYTRIEAIQVLGALKAKPAVEPLIQLATDESAEPFLNKKAIEALGQIGDPRAVPALMRTLTKERRGMSFYVESSFALFQLGAPAADALLPVLEGKDAELLTWAKAQGVNPASYPMKAAQVLGDLREKRAVPTLLKQLSFTHSDPQIQALVRMQAADALGRMRAQEAVKPLAGLVGEPDPTVRDAYVRALALLGSRDALPALEKAAGTGDWYSREIAMKGIALLGDAREQPMLAKLAAAEPARTAADCQETGEDGCQDAAALGKKRADQVQGYGAVLEAAQACSGNAGCWSQRLPKADAVLLQRAALEVGRSGAADQGPTLASRLTERDTEARATVIQAVDWLADAPGAAKKLREASLPALKKQLEDEKGNSNFVRVNEDLRRLMVKLERA
ncbi:HEAT repeat domain-containing protein [Corallococcus exiguus]|uniref:HEAT repeat domain-containing protein n=2 Tax=Corallococcus exiguus TaxID=83462 RepID=A0A7Y1WVP7_9BACT|nr:MULTISPECIES: HEAT repeat domain-containing protein [Corallococcus]NBC39370.1 HEAT repeat domain-containing protein [Corallococcus exiguus]NNB86401.1 HEAT repeat domain-containing protein [Corallococcus exiguus]NNC05728.1 HEAT repeat domain-containing protein [Corallococcus exiguus]NNC15870.1 HEAT repeat domain-containing protein [Corallococcus exiguus]NPC48119.1 HEAT repeat domain-containing protein [Corallococcus exiguus]